MGRPTAKIGRFNGTTNGEGDFGTRCVAPGMTETRATGPERPRKRRTATTDDEPATPRKKAAPRKPRSKAPEPIEPEAEPEATPLTPEAMDPEVARTSFQRRAAWFLFKHGSRAFLLFALFSSLWIGVYRFINPPVTPLMILRHVQEEEDLRKKWRGGDEISPDFLLAVVAAEDQLFFQHHGFDLKQISAAIDERLSGGRLRGGSTISQQVAKNVFLWPGRSWIRKGLEVWFTAGIELCWPKERILEIYVNVAEMGPGIYGVEAAAEIYFGKSAKELTRAECALLATVLPDPRDRSPMQPTDSMRARQDWILGQMRNLGGIEHLQSVGRPNELD